MEEEDVADLSKSSENVVPKVRGSVLDHFTRISNENESVRIKNGILLLKYLCTNTNLENEDNELKYALIRLVRGLGSSRPPAKIGFYSTLVTLLSTVPSLSATQVLACIEKQLQTGDSSSKSETGDIYTGQILGCGALIRSGLFSKAQLEEQVKILEIVLKAGKKRSYLGLASASFVADLLTQVDNSEFTKSVWPTLKQEILKPWPEQTLDTVYLMFLIRNRFPNALKGNALKKFLGNPEILCEDNLSHLCYVLLNIASVSSLKHPVYELISKEIAKSNVITPFLSQIDQQLGKSNRNRLLAVSIIIRNILASLEDQSQIAEVIVSNFIKEMIRYFSAYHNNNYDHEFQDYMTKFFNSLFACFKEERVEDKTKISVLRNLIFYPGTIMLEKITKTRILQQTVSTLNADGVKRLSKLIKDIILAETDKIVDEDRTKPWMNTERICAAQLLAKLLGHPKVQSEIEWKTKYLKFLINLGIVKHHKYGNIGIELAGTLREIFYRALDQKFPKLEDTHTVLLELVNHLQSSLDAQNYESTLKVAFTEDDFNAWQKVYATITKLSTKIHKKHVLVFQILFLHMGLQLFKDKEMAVASLNELFMCYDRLKVTKKSKKSETADSDDPEWIEVVIDLFLNLLSHSSHLLRNVICSVFPHLCKSMTPTSVHQILSVLDPKNEDSPLSKTDNESESDERNSSSSDEAESSDEEDVKEESDENDEDFDENETVNDKLRMAVRQALGNDACQSDEESVDLEEMSDTEGRRLDEALAQAFKQFKPNRGKSKKQSKDEETLTHFRVRVLDLVEIYLNSEPAMLACFEIMLPLLQLLEFTIRDVHQNPLQIRVRHCLRKLTSLKKFESLEGVTEDVLGDLLRSLLEKGTKSALMVQDMSNEISDCSIFLIKCSQVVRSDASTSKKLKKELNKRLIEILTDAINVYFNQRDCLIPYSLFKSMFQMNWDGNFSLAPLVFGFVFSESTRPFRRSQALELLKIFYSNNRMRSDLEIFKSHLQEHEAQFCAKVIELLDAFCQDPKSTKIKERFIYHVFNLLKSMALSGKNDGVVDWEKVAEKVREYRSHVTLSKDAKQAYNQLCAKLNVPNQVQMKNRTFKLNKDDNEANDAGTDSDSDDNGDKIKEKKHHRRKGATESKKLKKEARQLRIQSLSEGLSSSFSFTNVNMGNVADNEEEDEEETHPKRPIHNKKSKKNKNNEIVNGGGDGGADVSNSVADNPKGKSRKRANSEQDGLQYETSLSKRKKKKGVSLA